MKIEELFENNVLLGSGRFFLHGGPASLEGNVFKRFGKNGQDMGALFFIENTPIGVVYSAGYALTYKLKNNKEAAIWVVDITLPKNKIFDFTNSNHKKIARKFLSEEEYNSWEMSKGKSGQLDWSKVDDELMQEMGFEASYFNERNEGSVLGAKNIKGNAVSIGVFDPQYVKIIEKVPYEDAMSVYKKLISEKEIIMKIEELFENINEKWSKKYKDSINCSNPKGFSQKAHCAGRKKLDEKKRETIYFYSDVTHSEKKIDFYFNPSYQVVLKLLNNEDEGFLRAGVTKTNDLIVWSPSDGIHIEAIQALNFESYNDLKDGIIMAEDTDYVEDWYDEEAGDSKDDLFKVGNIYFFGRDHRFESVVQRKLSVGSGVKEFEQQVDEMPVTNYQTYTAQPTDSGKGFSKNKPLNTDPETFANAPASSYRKKADKKLVGRSEKRVRKAFGNTDHPFNFTFYNAPEANKHREVGWVDEEWVKQNLPKLADHWEPSENDINIIFTNNKGASWIPMTPWIMAHRIGHASDKKGGLPFESLPPKKEFKKELNHYTREFFQTFYDVRLGSLEPSYILRNNHIRKALIAFYQSIGTFRSARDKKLRDWFEFENEIIAQYLIKGDIELRAPPKYISGRDWSLRTTLDDDEFREEAKAFLDEMAYTLGIRAHNLFSAMEGEIFVM